VVDEETGLRVNGENLEEIAQGLARLLLNAEEAAAMGRRGRARVLENFTHERRVAELRLLASQGGKRSRLRALP
jgi:glycosyltransferase involved in cell wall biosynthesis